MPDHVRLRIPATAGHVGLARATATALAARLDFTYDRLMDLHIAIDEASGRILAMSDPPARRLDVTFDVAEDALQISVQGDSPLKSGAEFLNAWSKLILDSVAEDLHELLDTGMAGVRFVVKRGEPA
ncbi:MAG TPA: hypothetical protein VF972_03110 [Actinomycetota bacterium]